MGEERICCGAVGMKLPVCVPDAVRRAWHVMAVLASIFDYMRTAPGGGDIYATLRKEWQRWPQHCEASCEGRQSTTAGGACVCAGGGRRRQQPLCYIDRHTIVQCHCRAYGLAPEDDRAPVGCGVALPARLQLAFFKDLWDY